MVLELVWVDCTFPRCAFAEHARCWQLVHVSKAAVERDLDDLIGRLLSLIIVWVR